MLKFSMYNIVKKKQDCMYIYNTKNEKLVVFDENNEIEFVNRLLDNQCEFDINNPIVKTLYKDGYIVDSSLDEYKEVQNNIYKFLHNDQMDRTLILRLFVTMQCNFRCTYCFEEHEDRRMSPEIYEGVYLHIKNSLEKSEYDYVSLNLFGGEPLLDLDSIYNLLGKLHALKEMYPKVTFHHTIITNGYLLTPEVYDKLAELDVKLIQVTVDGFREHHDKQRRLVNGKGTWDKIIENLKYINTKNDNVEIKLRINVDNELINEIEQFRNWLLQTFDNKKFVLSIFKVVKFSMLVDDDLLYCSDNSQGEDAYDRVEHGVRSDNENSFKIDRYQMCPLNSKHFYSVLTDGSLVKCEDDKQTDEAGFENVIVGRITPDGKIELDQENLDLCISNMETEECKTCIMYPICCARTCPHKKAMSVLHGTPRQDCLRVKQDFENEIDPFIENKILFYAERLSSDKKKLFNF